MKRKSAWHWVMILMVALFVAVATGIGFSTYLQRYAMSPFRFGVYDYKYLPIVEIDPAGTNEPYARGKFPDSFRFTFKKNQIDNLDYFLESHACTAFLILKNDTLIYEKYFNGHGPEIPCKVFSITKAYMATLIGIAISEGQIGSIDDPLSKYIPEFTGDNREKITIRHCLDGKTGLKYVTGFFPWYDQPRMYYTTDVRGLLPGVEMAKLPGVDFGTDDYSPLLLGRVLEKATAMPVDAYFQQKIWQPLKTGTPAWLVLDSEENRFVKAESGLIARPMDVLRFGDLYLNGGKLKDTQIIPTEWIRSTTQPDSTCEYYQGEYYHNMWWGYLRENGEYTYSANGHFGQRLYVSPDTRTVVLRLGTDNAGIAWGAFLHSLVKALDSKV